MKDSFDAIIIPDMNGDQIKTAKPGAERTRVSTEQNSRNLRVVSKKKVR